MYVHPNLQSISFSEYILKICYKTFKQVENDDFHCLTIWQLSGVSDVSNDTMYCCRVTPARLSH